jgi:hypothetical protein
MLPPNRIFTQLAILFAFFVAIAQGFCLLPTREASARPKNFSPFSISGAGDLSATAPATRFTSASHYKFLRPFNFFYRIIDATPSIVRDEDGKWTNIV